MLVHPWDATRSDEEWRAFVRDQGFGHLVAMDGRHRFPVVVPTQFVLDGDEILIHLARPNPIWAALRSNPSVVLSVAGDWTYVPTNWRAIDGEDPRVGIPTTYYAAAQLGGTATVVDDDDELLDLLRRQLDALQPGIDRVDPEHHIRRLCGIRGIRLAVTDVKAKFKYGGNDDRAHRLAIADRLRERDGVGDAAARRHLLRRLDEEDPCSR